MALFGCARTLYLYLDTGSIQFDRLLWLRCYAPHLRQSNTNTSAQSAACSIRMK